MNDLVIMSIKYGLLIHVHLSIRFPNTSINVICLYNRITVGIALLGFARIERVKKQVYKLDDGVWTGSFLLLRVAHRCYTCPLCYPLFSIRVWKR